jgi:hypothetical protein
VVIDYYPNTFFNDVATLNQRQARWYEKSKFRYKLLYRLGRINVADPLSQKLVCLAVLTERVQSHSSYYLLRAKDKEHAHSLSSSTIGKPLKGLIKASQFVHD